VSDSSAYQIILAVRNRLAGIDLDSGFNTDMGARLYLGKRQFNESDLDVGPSMQLYMVDDAPEDSDRYVDPMLIQLGFTVAASRWLGDGDNPTQETADLIQDIKSAVLVIDGETLGGLSMDLGYAGSNIEYPEGGIDSVVVQVNFTALYEETYGAP